MLEVPEVAETKLEPPEDFSFPFKPYEIQKDFMKALFKALDDQTLGIFESPTGTGKSLSMLCGALTWLETHEAQRLTDLKNFIASFNLEEEEKAVLTCSNWISAQHELRKKKEAICKAKRELSFLEEFIAKRQKVLQNRKTNQNKLRMDMIRSAKKMDSIKSKSEANESKSSKDENDLDDILFDDFALDNYSDSDLSDNEDKEEPEFHAAKIIFASRTHSQLSQFSQELKRTSFSSKVTACTLGSRQNLCINPEVSRFKNLSLINERCLDLQKGSKGKKSKETKKMKACNGCPYYKASAIEDLKNRILSEPLDIEDLVNVAKNEIKACPYYAARKAAKEAQLILLPYNTILHAGTRDGVGIQTEKSVLLLDEAHNIIESISNMYSNQITLIQLKDCATGLEAYIKRYMARFNAENLLKLKQIRFIIKNHIQFLENESPIKNLFTIQEFKKEIGIDNLDLYGLLRFCQKYRLIFKLKGYMLQQQKLAIQLEDANTTVPEAKVQQKKKKNSKELNTTTTNISSPPVLSNSNRPGAQGLGAKMNSQSVLCFAEFFNSLKTANTEGRIIIDREQKCFKFLLLNVSPQFQDLVMSTRSIILAGGTMKPYDEIKDQLFARSVKEISHFSCDHVIPHDNLICLSLTKGPTSRNFDFTYNNRHSPLLMEELSKTITNVIRIVPGGVVCFLPSYDYEGLFYKFLQESNTFDKIDGKKKIFRERKDVNCDQILGEYSRQIKNNPNGALLFAVVGGKLSEGINFSDDLGRCVIVVGLPYPNITSVEIQEKVQYATLTFGKEKGDSLLTNMCSKAVNQSVGRAIRHSNDYATILLIDQRFARTTQQALLPNWIQQRSQVCDNFGQAIGLMGKFFAEKKKLQKTS